MSQCYGDGGYRTNCVNLFSYLYPDSNGPMNLPVATLPWNQKSFYRKFHAKNDATG